MYLIIVTPLAQRNNNLCTQALDKVRQNMEQKLDASFTIMLEEELGLGRSRVSATLSAATRLIQMMTVFKNEVAPCIPRTSFIPFLGFLSCRD